MGNQDKVSAAASAILKAAIVLPLFLAHVALHAQKIYMCKDESGHTLTSDRPIPECEGRAIREFDKSGTIRLIPNADTEEAIGWKDGLFKLNQTDIPEIMRQVARWYDVEIVYEGAVPGGSISGDISRNMNLSKVLKVLELSGVHCRIADKKIYVAP